MGVATHMTECGSWLRVRCTQGRAMAMAMVGMRDAKAGRQVSPPGDPPLTVVGLIGHGQQTAHSTAQHVTTQPQRQQHTAHKQHVAREHNQRIE